jgi:hypothetical protein
VTSDRFHGVQKEPAFKEIYYTFGNSNLLECQLIARLEKGDMSAIAEVQKEMADTPLAASDPKAVLQEWKEYIANRIIQKNYPDLPKKTHQAIMPLLENVDSRQLYHWGGSDCIKDIHVDGPVIRILVDKDQFDDLIQIPIVEKLKDERGNEQTVELNVGIYQIWRTQQAYASLSMYGGERIQFIVKDTEGNVRTIPGITDSSMD